MSLTAGNEVRVVFVVASRVSAEVLVGPLARRAARDGATVTVFSSGPRLEFDCEGIDHRPVRGLERRLSAVGFAASVASLRANLVELDPDHIHVSTPAGALVGGVASFLAGMRARTVVLYRGLRYETLRGPRRWVVMLAELFPSLICGRSGAISAAMVEELRRLTLGCLSPELVGPGSSRGVKVPLSASLRSRERWPSTPTVLYLGRIAHDKGIGVLAQAYSSVHSSFHLVLAGEFDSSDPPSSADIHSLAAHGASFLGYVPDPSALLSTSDVVVVPSLREGFGNVAIEAASWGVPTIASDVGGLREAVEHSVSGLLVEPTGPALAAALHSVLDRSPAEWSVGCRSHASRFESTAVLDAHWRWLTNAGI